MCARYTPKVSQGGFKDRFGNVVEDPFFEEWNEKVVPRRFSPVLVSSKGIVTLKPMLFSLIPKWSKDGTVKYATFNTRLDSVDKPTWKRPFETQRCLIPVGDFLEPIYVRKFAGHWVRFIPEIDNILFAAGIWDSWINHKTGEVLNSFSMLTDDPLPQVKEAGHARSPLFLKDDALDQWIAEKPEDLKTLQVFAKAYKHFPELKAVQDEAMKPGWEKRIPKEAD